MITTLFRAAPVDVPWFGHESYWTVDENFAERWAQEVNESGLFAPHRVYRAEVDIQGSADLPFAWTLPGDIIKDLVERLTAAGYGWLTFVGEPWEGRFTREYVYLGEDPIDAQPVG